MSKIISIHSFRGGTGKSNTTANVSVLLASQGYKVGVVDTDIQSPGIHVLFGFDESDMKYSLNDFLWGNCKIEQAAYDVTEKIGSVDGQLFLIPSSIDANDIARVLREGYDISYLNDGLQDLIKALELDVLVIDTHPGLNEETLLSIAISDVLAIILRPDQQDYQGTSVTVEVARKLQVPLLTMVVNKVPEVFDFDDVSAQVKQAYDAEVAAILPHSDEMMVLASGGVFVSEFPEHPITKSLKDFATSLMA
ncbi:MAG: MinD/ParA family protein [Anaerolineales bacterium]|nr:MinD/ParA family protein [Chloroflexota bacterium]MBL6982845.1 MinD/ParA family protein [Anaerolineales bacterium]